MTKVLLDRTAAVILPPMGLDERMHDLPADPPLVIPPDRKTRIVRPVVPGAT